MTQECPACWGSHGCDLPVGHPGKHTCIINLYDDDGEIYYTEQCCTAPQYEGQEIFCFMCKREDDTTKTCYKCEGVVMNP